jgi:hypothetical protein
VIFTLEEELWYPWNRRLGGHHSPAVHFGAGHNLSLVQYANPKKLVLHSGNNTDWHVRTRNLCDCNTLLLNNGKY